jgi:hypothetical protein
MPRKLQVDIDFLSGHHLLGITSQLKDYRLCHFLNQGIGLNLEKKPDVSLQPPSSKSWQQHPVYYFYDEMKRCEYYLLPNRGAEGLLLGAHRNSDFLMVVHGLQDPAMLKQISRSIQGLPLVLFCHEINLSGIRNIEYLLEDLELQAMAFRQYHMAI